MNAPQQLALFAEAPATPMPASLLPFRHPRAQRETRLDGHWVGYALRRARRRSIGFVVGPDGLEVAAPRHVSLAAIEAALQDKAAWVLRKLREQHERTRRLEATRIEWRDGTSVPFLGQPVTVRLDAITAGAVFDGAAAPYTLRIGLPHDAGPAQIQDAVQSWLQRQAKRVFEERCAHYAARLNVRVTRIALSSARTRWGSASADGSVRLHWRLVHFALPVVDYVVAHELAHLREMNHSAAFWAVVRSVLPDYEQARRTLRNDLLPALD